MDMKSKNKYRCPSCGEILERDETKKWMKSYCSATDKYVRLQLIKQ